MAKIPLTLSTVLRLGGRNAPERAIPAGNEDEMDLKGSYWTFSKLPFKQSLLSYDSCELEDVAIRMFNSTLVYAGIESSG